MLDSSKLWFLCEDETVQCRDQWDSTHPCVRCPKFFMASLTAPKLIQHMAYHILNELDLQSAPTVCGFCLSVDPHNNCIHHSKPGRTQTEAEKKGIWAVDARGSKCKKYVKFNIGPASIPSKSSPCTNIPMRCPFCTGDAAPAVWRYSMLNHIKQTHADFHVDATMTEHYTISPEEIKSVNEKESSEHRVGAQEREQFTAPKVSESHTSRMAFQYVCIPFPLILSY
jgi:hypothetical protein